MKSEEFAQTTVGPSCGPETCEACGSQFNCGATLGGCWCMEVKLTEAVRARLRSRYERCLCRSCLEHFAGIEEITEGAVEEKNG